MSNSVKTILRDVGLVLHLPGLMALLSMPVCLWFAETYALLPFLWTVLLSFGLGQLLFRLFHQADEARLPQAMSIAALAWLLVPLISTLPFLLIANSPAAPASATLLEFRDFWNAFFEAVSGFTSAGLTMTLRPSELPHSLQWWRSVMQWVGGVGVIVLVISILEPSEDAYRLYSAEGRDKKIFPNLRSTAQTIWWIYGLYTLIAMLLLWAAGRPLWEAINHSLTVIATGGFTITDNSIAGYSPAGQLVIIVMMTVGAISFTIHHQVLRERNWRALWESSQHRTLWILLALLTGLILLDNYLVRGTTPGLAALFQAASALGTAGFGTVDLPVWPPGALILLTVAMVIGGAAGSTAGGIKLNRATLLYRGMLWRFKRIISKPHELIRYRAGDQIVSKLEASRRIEAAGVLTGIWIVTLLLGILILLHLVPVRYTTLEVVFEAASALSAVGLSVGITQPDLAWPAKLGFIGLMWMGRLEIVPALILIVWPVTRRARRRQ